MRLLSYFTSRVKDMSCHGGEDWYILLFWGENTMEENQNVTQQKPSGALSIIPGIISLICAFLSSTIFAAVIGFILAIIATVSGNNCKKQGGTIAGFVMGVIGIIFNAVGFIACVACAGALSMM